MATKFDDIISELNLRLKNKLPGKKSHIKMAPQGRFPNGEEISVSPNAVPAAVLILLYPEKNNVYIPVIQRNDDGQAHSGQISFPGGHAENSDMSYNETAIREANEEIGVIKNDIKIIGQLSELYIPVTNFIVYPVVGYLDYLPSFIPDKSEVADILKVSIDELLNPEINTETVEVRNYNIKAPYYYFSECKIWGATAMILKEFSDILND